MRSRCLSLFLGLLALVGAQDEQTTHGDGEEGSSMGPVAFLWPPDRTWNAVNDNTGPCGSPNGRSNRTSFPLSQGSVALSIADDAWHVAFRLAVSDNPTTQADFDDQVVDNITDVDPGHQCYKFDALENIVAGTNATIQLEYWAEYEGENNGNNQSFFACADITFVETTKFTAQVPCFNVTSEEFDAPTPTPSTAGVPSPTGLTSQEPSAESAASYAGLSTGAKVGIAMGSVIGGLALIGVVAFFVWRRGKTAGLKGKEEYELRAKNLNASPAE
ncbi:hypothetical protein K458DRAFT_368573 [Lentithecium fluviatile CBS 122367]|uniref:Copper acquisition factor BIM1-like domain-containing protein n=1 Tax=Lentithecium fluviatile CBS 122367 TaxID=1168545 RepID=A0A6G1IYL4_9PLEO|nr:hypothetical protein K458DRAFT_368573 [Lentithecium fluviatile CBS 122367]